MAMLMIRCPTGGRAISTGIEVDPALYASTPVFLSQTFCPYCGVNHEWFAQEAWVSDLPAAEAHPHCENETA